MSGLDQITDTSLEDSIVWLQRESHRLIRASALKMRDGTLAFPPQVGTGYQAFWLRDYEYTLEGNIDAYSDEELIASCGLFVNKLMLDGAAVDCVQFDGNPIYKPGFGTLGKNPVADGSQFTVGVAWHTYQKTQDSEFLHEVLNPLIKTMRAVPRNPKTNLVHIVPGEERDRCSYGFTDTIRKEGDVLFCSLLYAKACGQLSGLLNAGDREDEAGEWKQEGRRVEQSIRKNFWDPDAGLFRAATIKCREHDIWGSAFAVYLGVADIEQSTSIAHTFKTLYAEIVQHGHIRHLPGGVFWEQGCDRNSYQNGAYWATPSGWFVYTLDLVDASMADKTIVNMVDHFKQYGACEWIFGEDRILPNYLVSASLPLAGIRSMMERRAELTDRSVKQPKKYKL